MTVAIIQIDATGGTFLGVSSLQQGVRNPFLSLGDALDIAKRNDSSRSYGSPKYVWFPCRESTSPSYPFCMIPFDNNALYISMNGRIFDKLTPLGLGG